MHATPPVQDLWERYQKAQGRVREEKRAARLLRLQLVEERAAAAQEAVEEVRGSERVCGRRGLGWGVCVCVWM